MINNIWDDKYKAGDSLNKYPWDKIVSFVFRHYPRKKPKHETKVLELGFGSGCNLWFCAREGFDCYGVEFSSIAVEYAKNWFLKENLKAKLCQVDFYPLHYGSDFFDLIIDRCSLTCVSLEKCLLSLKEIFRTLKPGAYFCFNPYSTKHTSYIEGEHLESGLTRISTGTLLNVGDLKFYNEEEIENLVQSVGFKICQMRHIDDRFFNTNEGNHAEYFLVLQK
jgi:ubiquinone/menaquinone biosynthesis C-methylase UbiE